MKKILPIAFIVVIVGLGSFFGGMKYAQSKNPSMENSFNLNGDQGGLGAGMITGNPQGNRNSANRVGGAGFTTGEIISKDDTSVTIKLIDGGSKIILYSDATEVSKFTSGESVDLGAGKTIVVTGQANEDGSITAQTIQIRPEIQE